MSITQQKQICKARDFAIQAHGAQQYGEYPYQVHLFSVFQILEMHSYTKSEYLIVALLHDVLEDCKQVTEKMLFNQFGKEITNAVIALTNLPDGRPNYTAIKANKIATSVKIADTISNVGFGMVEFNPKSIKYVMRYPEFKEQLYNYHDINLWRTLESRLIFYKSIMNLQKKVA